jgi:hypothetical protein
MIRSLLTSTVKMALAADHDDERSAQKGTTR